MVNEEQFASLTDAVRAAASAALRGLFTALPAGITADSDGHTAKGQSNILGLVRQDDGTMKQQALPTFDTIPVHFSGGGRMVATHPVKSGDDGILLFMARAIDSWHQSGGQQVPIDAREHHLSDHVFINGLRADPKKLKNYAPDSHQVRSLDAKVTTDHHPDNGVTTKVVDPSDGSSNPFGAATTYHQTTHSAAAGIVHTATDGNNLHTSTLEKAAGYALKIVSSIANHAMKLSPAGGLATSVISSSTASHTLNLTPSGGFQAFASDPAAGTSCSIGAHPSGVLSFASSLPSGGLSLPSGGVSSGALASGAAASNVGALSGDLSGTLPAPSVVGATGLPNYANNAAARAAGLPAGRFYVNTSISGTEHVVCITF